jgi:regulator of protease activity HflC (stomatin/prohibitin superfamily)
MERYSTTVDREVVHKDPDAIVKVAYANFVREPMRTFALDEVQRRNGLEVKDALIAIGDAVLARIRAYADGSPFIIDSVVVGNVQYPEEVANAVSRKLAANRSWRARIRRSRSHGRNAPSAKCRRKVSPTRWRSSADS